MIKQVIFTLSLTISFCGMSQLKMMDVVQFVSAEKAEQLLLTEDAFTNAWSVFDIQARLQNKEGTKAQLFDTIAAQIRSWSDAEIDVMQKALKRIDYNLFQQNIQLSLPDTLFFVKTTCKEEGGATAYTRGNYIVFKENLDKKGKQLEQLILHELFHILTRRDRDFKEKMYRIIGFELTEEIAYPSVLQERKLTNPDAPLNDSFITLKNKRKTSDYVMILYSDRSYTDGSFFEYLNTGLMMLFDDEQKKPALKNGVPEILELTKSQDFFKNVGRNTKYIIHPEEIMAENFSFALTNKTGLPNPEIIESVIAVLKPSD